VDEVRARIEPDELPDESLADRTFALPERVAHYLRDVRRMEPGDPVELFDGTGRVLTGRLQVVRDNDVRMAVFDDRVVERNESPCRITLCQAIPKGKRWRWVLEKTTELGVHRIRPMETDHTIVEISEQKEPRKLERWGRIVGSAARQSERTRTPEIDAPCSLETLLDEPFDGRDIALHARQGSEPLAELAEGNIDEATDLRLWIGPEGGFSEQEAERLAEAGVAFGHLGPRILRTETAAVVAVSLVQNTLGDLRQPREPDSR
jgi:16S rRNA (uracil1498-N3)-methyltransferase